MPLLRFMIVEIYDEITIAVSHVNAHHVFDESNLRIIDYVLKTTNMIKEIV